MSRRRGARGFTRRHLCVHRGRLFIGIESGSINVPRLTYATDFLILALVTLAAKGRWTKAEKFSEFLLNELRVRYGGVRQGVVARMKFRGSIQCRQRCWEFSRYFGHSLPLTSWQVSTRLRLTATSFKLHRKVLQQE